MVDHQGWLGKTILLKELVNSILIEIVGVLNCLHSNLTLLGVGNEIKEVEEKWSCADRRVDLQNCMSCHMIFLVINIQPRIQPCTSQKKTRKIHSRRISGEV